MVKTHVEESLGANPADAAINPADSVAMGVQSADAPRFLQSHRGRGFRALAHRQYQLLFAAFCINQTGFWISHVSLQQLMVDLTHNDPTMSGWLFFFLFLPAFFFAPIAGVAADRFDRKRIVLICYAAVALIASTLSWTTAIGVISPALLMGLSFVMGTAFAFSGPPNFAIAANSVPDDDLPSAVSLQSAANNLTRVAGPLLAAKLVATGALAFCFGIYALAASAAGTLVSRIRLTTYEIVPDGLGILGRMKSGLSHARERKPAVPALCTVAVMTLFGVSHMALVPVFVDEILNRRELFSYMVAATGSGALVGAIVTGYRTTTLRTSAGQFVAYGIALATFATTEDWRVAMAAQVLIGFFYFSVMTSLQTIVQQVVDDDKRGRVMSLFQVCWAGLVPFGGLGMGAAADAFGVVPSLVSCSLICAAYGLALFAWQPKPLEAASN